MNRFVAAHAQDGGTEYLLGIRVYHNLDETLGFTLLHRSRYARHHSLAHQNLTPRFTRLHFRHARASQRRIDKQSVGLNTVAQTTGVIVQQIVGYDFVVVVRCVRKRSLAIDVTDRPDVRNVRPQLIVDLDVASLIEIYAGLVVSPVS